MTNFSWQESFTPTSVHYTLWPKDECESERVILMADNSKLIFSYRKVPKLLNKSRKTAEKIVCK